MRRIAAAAGFATGAALALAPFAAADTPITTTVDSEIASLNSLFEGQAALAGDSADVTKGGVGVFDTILPADAPQVTNPSDLTILDYELFGVNPIKAGIASDPGSFNDFNGALGKFDDAYNVYLYAAENGGNMDMNDADFIGSASSIDQAQTLTVAGAEQYFLNFGLGDLEGYFGIFPAPVAAAADPAAVVPITSTFDSEVSSMNSLFTLEADLAGVGKDIIPPSAGDPFETIPLADAPQTAPLTTLDYELYGVNPIQAGIAGDPGSFEVFNGALGKFDDAFNIALYAAENGGAIDPNAADFIGSASSIATGLGEANATDSFDYFWNFAVGDLSGFLQTPLTFLDITPPL